MEASLMSSPFTGEAVGDRPVFFGTDDAPKAATFERDYADAVAHLGLDEAEREHFRLTHGWMGELGEGSYTLVDVVDMVNMGKRFGSEREPVSTFSATAPAVSPPDGLSKDGLALYKSVEERSLADKIDFLEAFAKVTGNREYDPPRPVVRAATKVTAEEGVEDEDGIAQGLMRSHGIGYLDAVQVWRHTKELAEAKKDPEPAKAPWLDTRPLSTPPRPWADEDWERDSRRAAAAGVPLERVSWEVAAEEGRDLVGEEGGKAREQHIAQLEGRNKAYLARAQKEEAELRAKAIEAELDRRARERLNPRGLTGPSSAVFR